MSPEVTDNAPERRPVPEGMKAPQIGGVDFRPHSLEIRRKAFDMFKAGKNHAQISKTLDVPPGTVKRWSSKERWRKQIIAFTPSKSGAKSPLLIDTSSPEVEAETLNMTLDERQKAYEDRMSRQALRLPAIMERMTDQAVMQSAEKISKMDTVARKALRLEERRPSVVVNVGLLSAPVPEKALEAPAKSLPPIDVEALPA